MISRKTLKRRLPGFAANYAKRLRAQLNGPGIEYEVLQEYVFVPDPTATPRINLIIPSLSAKTAFGGVTTGINFFAGVAEKLKSSGFEMRIVAEQVPDSKDNVLDTYPALSGCQTLALGDQGNRIPIRSLDIFIVFNWWTSLNLEPALAAQAKHFDQKAFPKIHLIQEYEPHFYPFSSAHLLAREAMGGQWPLWAVFNTRELHDFWQAQEHRADKIYIFEPRLNAALRLFANDRKEEEKRSTILVYGRPQIPRNAFFLIQRGLEHWARTHGTAHPGWRIVSAGMAHKDIALGNEHLLQSLGKLSLEEYGQLLRETAIGVSLMASPHPSYPPLEMAHFGIRVLTNSYTKKIPETRHENLVTLTSIRANAISEMLESEIVLFEADPGKGLRGKSHMPDYLGEDRIECVKTVAGDISAFLGN